MATHSSILAWEILWTELPGGLQPKGLQRVRYDWMMKYTQTSQHHFIIGAVRLREVEQFVFDLTASSWERKAMTPWLWSPYPYILLLLFLSSFVCVNFLLSLFVCFLVLFKNTYLALPGLSCHTWDLQSLGGVWVFSCGMWDLVPRPEIELRAPALVFIPWTTGEVRIHILHAIPYIVSCFFLWVLKTKDYLFD